MSVYVLLWELLIISYLRVVYSNKGGRMSRAEKCGNKGFVF